MTHLKILSKADIEFIKKSLRFLQKNKELNHKDNNRLEYMLQNLDKDDSMKIFAELIELYEKASLEKARYENSIN
jgi:hypothetical protein